MENQGNSKGSNSDRGHLPVVRSLEQAQWIRSRLLKLAHRALVGVVDSVIGSASKTTGWPR